MNTKSIQKQFLRIGARFTVKPHEAVTHIGRYAGWRNRIHEPEVRTQGRECLLVYESSFQEQLDVEAVLPAHLEDVLILSLAWFHSRRAYVCRVVEDRLEAVALPETDRRSIAHYVEEIERTALRLSEQKQSRNKRLRKQTTLSFAAAQQRSTIVERDYEAYIRLVTACRGAKFLQERGPVVRTYETATGNTYLDALLRIAKQQRAWLRPPETWRPPSHNSARAFQSLLEHLFARYPVPAFLESVWFRQKENWIPCYVAVARGVNIRQVAALQFPLTKKMAHHMMLAPGRLTMEEAIRWGQVHGLGGEARFYGHIAESRILAVEKCNPEGHAFWQTVLAWLLTHPMLAPGHYGPLIDYIRRERQRDPDYKIAGRSPQALLRAMDVWHRDLNQHANRTLPPQWIGHNLDWWWTQKDRRDGMELDWRIVEITTAERLRFEGRTMRHCVYSYARACARGELAIFSLQEGGKPLLTIAYAPRTRQIGEVRGTCNRVPTPAEWNIIQRWAMAKQIG